MPKGVGYGHKPNRVIMSKDGMIMGKVDGASGAAITRGAMKKHAAQGRKLVKTAKEKYGKRK